MDKRKKGRDKNQRVSVSYRGYGQQRADDPILGDSLPLELKIALIAIGLIYTFAALIGFFGFLGAVLRKTGFVKTYFTLLCITFALQLAASIGGLVVFYRARNSSEGGDCSNKVINLNDPKSIDEFTRCAATEALRNVPQGWAIAGAIVPVVLVACEHPEFCQKSAHCANFIGRRRLRGVPLHQADSEAK